LLSIFCNLTRAVNFSSTENSLVAAIFNLFFKFLLILTFVPYL